MAVVRIEDEVYAIGDRCTHKRVSLSDGEVDNVESLLECLKHCSQFSPVIGEPHQLPALKATPVYSVDVRSGDAVLTLP